MFSLHCMKLVLVTQSCLTLWNPMDCSLPGSAAHGILQARILEWVAIFLLQGIFPTQGLNPGLLPGENLSLTKDFPGGSDGKEYACNAGDLGSTSGLERSPGERNSYTLQCSCWKNSMVRGAWQATVHMVPKSWTWLNHFHFQVMTINSNWIFH